MVKKGHIRSIGLSEVRHATLRKPLAAHPAATVQTDHPLCIQNFEIAVFQAWKQWGTAFVSLSPAPRRFFCDQQIDKTVLNAEYICRGTQRFCKKILLSTKCSYLLTMRQHMTYDSGYSTSQLSLA